jgi:hypothetical protein
MGQHVWLLLATIITELLAIVKWSKGQYTNPLPLEVKWGWTIGAILLVLYPTFQVSIPDASSLTVALSSCGIWELTWLLSSEFRTQENISGNRRNLAKQKYLKKFSVVFPHTVLITIWYYCINTRFDVFSSDPSAQIPVALPALHFIR